MHNLKLFVTQGIDGKSEESILRQYLLRNYSADIRPVINSFTVTYVKISLTIIQIMDLVSA